MKKMKRRDIRAYNDHMTLRASGFPEREVRLTYGSPVAKRQLPTGNQIFLHYRKGDPHWFLVLERDAEMNFVRERQADIWDPDFQDGMTFFKMLGSEINLRIESDYLLPDNSIDLNAALKKHPIDEDDNRNEMRKVHEPQSGHCPICGWPNERDLEFCPGCWHPKEVTIPGPTTVRDMVAEIRRVNAEYRARAEAISKFSRISEVFMSAPESQNAFAIHASHEDAQWLSELLTTGHDVTLYNDDPDNLFRIFDGGAMSQWLVVGDFTAWMGVAYLPFFGGFVGQSAYSDHDDATVARACQSIVRAFQDLSNESDEEDG